MKILFVHNGVFPHPAANMVQVENMYAGFKKAGADVTLLAFGTERPKYTLLKNWGPYWLRSFRLFFNSKGYDNIYTRDLLFAYLVKTFRKAKVIYELHDLHGPSWRFLFDRTFKKLDKLVVISEGLKEELGNDKKIAVLHDGVDLKIFNTTLSKAQARKKLKLPAKKNIAVYTGTFQDWKGHHTVLEAAEDSDIFFVLVGARNEKELELGGKNAKIVKFSNQTTVSTYLKAADVLLLPNNHGTDISDKYTSPLKLFEYMAAKRPILASDLPSINNIVSDEEVIFFQPGNYIDMKQKILTILKNRPLQEKHIQSAFKKVQGYTWEKRAKKIMGLFK